MVACLIELDSLVYPSIYLSVGRRHKENDYALLNNLIGSYKQITLNLIKHNNEYIYCCVGYIKYYFKDWPLTETTDQLENGKHFLCEQMFV